MQPVTIQALKQVAALKEKVQARPAGDSVDIVAKIKEHLAASGRQYSVKAQDGFDYYEITEGECLTGSHGGSGFGFQVFGSGAATYHCHHNTCAGATGKSAWDVMGIEKKGKVGEDKKPQIYKLDEILAQVAELRTEQATFWLKLCSDEDLKEPNWTKKARGIINLAGGLDETELQDVIEEMERHPPLLPKARVQIKKIWSAAKRELKRIIKPKATDDMIADAYKARFEDQRMYTRSRWYSWNGNGVWSEDSDVTDEIWDQMVAMKDSDVTPSSNKRRSVEERLRGQSIMGIAESCVDARPELLNFTNGVYDISTGEMQDASHDLYLTTQLPFDYDQEAECPKWLQFLSEVLVDKTGDASETMIQFIQQAFGYSLTAWTKHEVSFWLQGGGSNGKSTLLAILAAMSGTAATSLNLGILERDAYQLAQLPGIRVVTCAESPVGLKVADAIVKGLISGDAMSVRLPYSAPFQLHPTCKVWWAMNNPPRVADSSDGFWRRVRVIPFRASFGKQDNQQEKDIDLKAKLLAELPGIFNWALDGLLDLEESGWVSAAEIDEATDAYRESNDVERAFIFECCLVGDGYRVPAKQLYEAYRTWCGETGHRHKSMTRVASDWIRIGFHKRRGGMGIEYLGVGLMTDEPAPLLGM